MGSGEQRLHDWISSMHFGSYDEAYNWIKNNQSGKVYKAQYEALDSYFHVFVELPFVELQPADFLQQIQRGIPPNIPESPQFPRGITSEPSPPEPEPEPSTNPISRLFNALRGIFR